MTRVNESRTPRQAIRPTRCMVADLLYEIIDGREVAKPILGALEHVVMSVLAIELGLHAKQHDLGRVVAEGLFRIHPTGRRMRMPDVAFVSKERWGRDRKVTSANGIDVVPDLAVEVVSPTDHAVAVLAKVREYQAAGVVQVWLIYAKGREVHIFEGATGCRIIRADGALDGGALLPGFRLTLAELFRDAADEPAAGAGSGGVGVDPE